MGRARSTRLLEGMEGRIGVDRQRHASCGGHFCRSQTTVVTICLPRTGMGGVLTRIRVPVTSTKRFARSQSSSDTNSAQAERSPSALPR
jgi:hypothetical protein